jgi:hypothetical protein
MPTFEALPHFGKDWGNLTPRQQSTFPKVVKEASVPDPMAQTGCSGRVCGLKAWNSTQMSSR